MKHSFTPSCSCLHCVEENVTREEKIKHLEAVSKSRREFITRAGRLALSFGLGGGLIVEPLAAAALNNDDASYQNSLIRKNKSIKKGKSQLLVNF